MSPFGIPARSRALPLFTLCVPLAVLLCAAPAKADETDALITRGVELRRAGNDQAALEQFRRAYDLKPSSRALAQMGLAEQALARWVDAEAHLARALESAGGEDAWIDTYRETLRSSSAEIARHLGWLTVAGPDGAELRLDGRRAGALPLERPLRIPVGTFTLDAFAGGHVFATRTVTVLPGELTREDVAPRPAATSTPAAAPLAPPAPRAAVSDVRARQPQRRPEPSVDRRTLAWISAGTALAAATAGGLLLYFGDQDTNDYNRLCRGTPTGAAMQASCDDLYSSGSHKQTAGGVGLVVAGALGVAAGVLFLSPSGSSPHADASRVACAPTLTAPGAACALRF